MVKQGYKQTEIGVIPEDWTVDTIDSVTLSVATGGNYKNSIQRSPYPLIKMGNLSRGHINLNKIEYVIDSVPSEKDRLSYGDVLFNTRNTPELVGKVAVWKNELPIAYFNSNLLRFNFNCEKSNSFFMNLIFNTKQVIAEFKNISKGTTSVAAIYPQDMLKVKIKIPPIQEQNRIAEALSDVDSMISSLEKLIAKKKNVKQGAMQELLTGKKRLLGFTGEWVEKKIEDIVVRFATGLNPRQNFKLNNGGTNYYVTIKDFREGKLFLDDACDRIDNEALARINERSDLRKNDLLFSSIGRIGDAYLITETPKNWNINESVFTLRPNLQIIYPLMLFYLLTSEDIKNKLLDSTTGSTLKSIKLGHLKEIFCRFPQDIGEQIAISSILSDMDNEIESLEQKLAKARQVKQGMMQQLLTGKIRLV